MSLIKNQKCVFVFLIRHVCTVAKPFWLAAPCSGARSAIQNLSSIVKLFKEAFGEYLRTVEFEVRKAKTTLDCEFNRA